MKKIIISVMVVVITGIGLWVWYNHTHLLVESTDPKDGNTKVDTLHPISITFNHYISPAAARNFTISPAVQGNISVNGTTFTFTPTTAYQLNSEYTATLKQPVSMGGLQRGDITLHFKVSYLSYSDLSKKQQQAHLDRTDSIQRQYPILQSLPYETLNYKIDYALDSNNKITLLISLYGIYNRPSQAASYQHQLIVDQQQALTYLASKGVKPTTYRIIYNPPISSPQTNQGD